MGLSELLLRIPLSFVVLLCLVRLLGRQEISQMNFFNFVSAITIGAISANLVFNPHLKIINGVLSLVGWSIFTIGMQFVDIKSKKVRKIIKGEPVILVKNGKIMERSLRKTRLDVNALNALLRQKGVFSLTEVEYAIFETDGNLSVMKKELSAYAEKDINSLAAEVVSNGIVNLNNLSKLNLSREGLHQLLKKSGVKSLSDVFYAEIDQEGKLFIDYMNDQVNQEPID